MSTKVCLLSRYSCLAVILTVGLELSTAPDADTEDGSYDVDAEVCNTAGCAGAPVEDRPSCPAPFLAMLWGHFGQRSIQRYT